MLARRTLIFGLLLFVGMSCVVAQSFQAGSKADSPASNATAIEQGEIPLRNAGFAAEDDAARRAEGQPVADWFFARRTEGVSVHAVADGAMMVATGDLTRGDLMSSAAHLAPFHGVEIELEYEVVAGAPLLYAGVRPFGNRLHVAQEFLPVDGEPGRRRTAKATVRTGELDGEYRVQVSLGGDGIVILRGISACVTGPVRRPEKPLLVLDIARPQPDGDDELRWKSMETIRAVFGFPEVVEVHYTNFDAETIEAEDPACIAISGISDAGKTKRMVDAVRTCLDSRLPVIGICGGHQFIAKALGHGGLQAGKEWGDFPVTVTAKDDPLFEGAPESGAFHVSYSHNWMLRENHGGMISLARTEVDENAVCRHPEHPWISFQGHIERGWADAAPAGYLLWRNVFREWDLID